MTKRKPKAADKPHTWLPALIQEREAMLNARLRSKRVKPEDIPSRICNASTRHKGAYKTGDGEVLQSQRPGSDVAYKLPSRGIRA